MLPYVLPNLLLIFIQIVSKSYFYTLAVPVRRKKLFLWPFSVLLLLVWGLNNIVLPKGAAILDIAIVSIQFFGSLFFTKKGFRLKGILTNTIFFVIEVIVMYALAQVAYPIAEGLGYPPESLVNKTTSYGNALMILICTPCILIPDYLSVRLLNRLFRDRELSVWILCFLPIPVSQSIILNLLNRMVPYAGGIRGLNAAFFIALLASVAADIGFFAGVRRVQRAELLKYQVRAAEEQLSIQESYYQQLQDNILAINQIRHDLSNQLQAAYYLLEQGEQDRVRTQLDQLQADVRDRVGPTFCANLMVDAVLSQKSRQCREYGIRFDANAQLPPELPISGAHLCSVFSNLLDNSLHGAQEAPCDDRWIELRASVNADHLIIRCSNSTGALTGIQPQKSPMRQHGLGLGILKQIADLYHGSFETQRQDGRFEVTLILRFPSEYFQR